MINGVTWYSYHVRCLFIFSPNVLIFYIKGYLIFKLYLISFVAILSVFWLCKNLPYIPLICYFGRYSIIILGTHQLLVSYTFFAIRSFSSIHGNILYFTIFMIVMFLEFFIIKLLIKYFPRFTAQEEFFKSGWKM